MPTGISTGEMRVRDTVSAAVRKEAPRRKEQGTIILLSTPNIILSMWGIIRPTNPIVPVSDTETAVISDVVEKRRSLMNSVLTPRLVA